MSRLFLFFFILPILAPAQKKQNYKVAIVGFYNCENFYDTVHNPMVKDDEFTPKGERKYTSDIYLDKVSKLATVISQVGTDISRDGLALLGVAEVENDTVLSDLIHHPLLEKRKYSIIHYDSKDERGIDVGLIYNPKYFTPEQSKPLVVTLPSRSKYERHTRDILWVKGKLDGETVHVLVNHWPSRLGSVEKSEPGRIAAAAVCKVQVQEIAKTDSNAKIIVMGDLNDDPISPSVTKVLKAKGKAEDVKPGEIFNPWVDLYERGIGTIAYQDTWALFDQIMVTYPWLNKQQDGFFFQKPYVFNQEFMVETTGAYKGYPMRTWNGLTYRGGYSDHFPAYIVLLKKTK
ncbi:endonuclease/exonuclease/phosphatase [Parasediminibacterium sp. JCM 36343]|uniref:endonuclease/exonuclease/phosphatase family protein n=1 Tax=Parasediminibacterium sp. JCM 36343 TaxID=3374279 RepID=UPI00397D5BB1